MNVNEFLLGLESAQMCASVKKTFLPKVQACRLFGKRLVLVSVDIEAYSPGDPRYKPDKLILVIGLQRFIFQNNNFRPSKMTQYMLNGNTVLDLARKAFEYCKGADGIVGHWAQWDIETLRDYGIRAGLETRLPPVAIDLMTPFRCLGISNGQEHLALHHDWGVVKGTVSLERWQDATIGELLGLKKSEVMALRRKLRDERNKTCMQSDLLQIKFLSRDIKYMGRLTVKEVYPNEARMEALERC